MITKEEVIDRIEIVGENRHVQVGRVTVIKEDGVEISRTLHRHVIAPGEDYSAEDPEVIAHCALAHTPARITAYRAAVAER